MRQSKDDQFVQLAITVSDLWPLSLAYFYSVLTPPQMPDIFGLMSVLQYLMPNFMAKFSKIAAAVVVFITFGDDAQVII